MIRFMSAGIIRPCQLIQRWPYQVESVVELRSFSSSTSNTVTCCQRGVQVPRLNSSFSTRTTCSICAGSSRFVEVGASYSDRLISNWDVWSAVDIVRGLSIPRMLLRIAMPCQITIQCKSWSSKCSADRRQRTAIVLRSDEQDSIILCRSLIHDGKMEPNSVRRSFVAKLDKHAATFLRCLADERWIRVTGTLDRCQWWLCVAHVETIHEHKVPDLQFIVVMFDEAIQNLRESEKRPDSIDIKPHRTSSLSGAAQTTGNKSISGLSFSVNVGAIHTEIYVLWFYNSTREETAVTWDVTGCSTPRSRSGTSTPLIDPLERLFARIASFDTPAGCSKSGQIASSVLLGILDRARPHCSSKNPSTKSPDWYHCLGCFITALDCISGLTIRYMDIVLKLASTVLRLWSLLLCCESDSKVDMRSLCSVVFSRTRVWSGQPKEPTGLTQQYHRMTHDLFEVDHHDVEITRDSGSLSWLELQPNDLLLNWRSMALSTKELGWGSIACLHHENGTRWRL